MPQDTRQKTMEDLGEKEFPVPDLNALRHAVEIASAKVCEFALEGPNLQRAIDRVHAQVAASKAHL